MSSSDDTDRIKPTPATPQSSTGKPSGHADAPAQVRMDAAGVMHGAGPNLVYHPVNYARIFYFLVALTALTVLASFLPIHNELVKVLIAAVIATAKAVFVVRFFMHLKFEGRLIYTIFIAPLLLAFFLTLALIPDIGLGRETAFNDMVGYFVGKTGQ